MLELTPADFTIPMMSPGPPAQGERVCAVFAEHKLTELPNWQYVGSIRKHPQHQCKVCSLRKQKMGERCATRFYCETCSGGNKRNGTSSGNGENRLVERDIQMREKRRRTSDAEKEEDATEEQEDAAEDAEDAENDACEHDAMQEV
ncbi:hypothetical protein PR003_g14778 [Phytophthora rubi]|uniref:PiggyBac transposable element-derived protein 4 C-terminal zinc-ribbon domain-containing protein n=1 Tax=Phytophthora rubi TaxID=129364 RepID=A0A6A4FD01_9STRA|nr:hypothetical protein PR001_g13968 [Phytophthora rubi]KAE9019491.1 hypothetical protein PR002_g12801 [Phytophthora rubi]KAE9331906.1 hypothetical protein PR003_g14778 [Phytophthora rubi]